MVPPLGRTSGRTFVLASLLLAAGCLNNPAKPTDPDSGITGDVGDGSPPTIDARVDGPAIPDSAIDRANADVDVDGNTAADGGRDGGVDLPADTMTCPGACTVGDKRCGSGGGVQTCAAVAGACPAWGAETACTGRTMCAGTPAACTCAPGPAGCTAAGTFCQGTGTLATCAKDGNGCFFVSGTTSCPAMNCGGALPNGACGCNNTCNAGQVGSYCADAKTVATCTADSTKGCFASSNPMTCPGAKTCQGAAGSAACACPAAGTGAGSGCATPGATSCDGAAVLTCTTDAASGCNLWAKTTDCGTLAGGPFTCGTGGGAHCQCPDATTSAIYVDPVGGSDGGGSVPSNGAATPPACRFKTLTKAVTAVTAARKKIIATTAAPPASFSAETFPLTLPAGVTLTTADPTPAAGNYTIVFNSANNTGGVVLSDGAVLEGFIVQAGTNVAASPVSCATGTVTVHASTIVGGAGNGVPKLSVAGISIGRAVQATDTCTGAISGVEVRGFRTGLMVLTGSATPVAITDVTLRDNGITGSPSAGGAGLLIGAGKVNATRLTINKSSAGTAATGVLLEPSANISPPIFTASELTVADLGQAGVELRAGMAGTSPSLPTATLTNGDLKTGDVGLRVAAGTLTATGTRVHNATGDGVTVTGGTAVLHKVNLVDNGGRGLNVAGGTVTIDDGSAATSNGTDTAPADGIGILGGTVTIGGGSGQRVDVGANTGAGIKVAAPGAATVTISRAQVHNSAKIGLDLDLAADGGKVTVTDCDVHDNASDGVRLVRGPASTGAAVSLDDVRVYMNGVGVSLRADTGDLVASVKNCAIHDNRDTGLVVQQGTGNTTTATIEGNDVLHNNTSAGRPVGGILFATPSTLASFAGNKVHGNPGDEMGFDAKPNGGDTWDLSGPLACTAPNVLSCYNLAAGGMAVGLRILATAPAGTKVNAANVSWANAVPAKGVDFDFGDVSNAVTALPACTPAANSCP